MCSYKKYLQWALGATLAVLQGFTLAAGYVDVLDLPARPSALAAHSPLLGAARAGERLVAVGQRGHILYSDDSGNAWQQAAVPVSADLNAVSFPSPTQGWAVGNDGVILHSSDAGATWNKQLDGRQIGALLVKHYSALASAEPANEQWAQLAADGQRLVEEGADKPLLDVWFANEKVGYVVGVFNLILRTEDGGQHWTPFQDRTDNPQSLHLNAIASTGDGLFIVGEQGCCSNGMNPSSVSWRWIRPTRQLVRCDRQARRSAGVWPARARVPQRRRWRQLDGAQYRPASQPHGGHSGCRRALPIVEPGRTVIG
jgi:photosystem II stability/assembly factor-like uncharacterized protein